MLKPEPTFIVTNYDSLNKFLMGTLTSIRKKEIDVESAVAISQISDKIVKNNLTKIMYQKMLGTKNEIDFFEPKEKQVMIG